MLHTISVLAENHPGVLSRLAGLVSRRGYNVNSLSVGKTHSPGLSRFTLVVEGDDVMVDQITKQIAKLVEAVEVTNLSEGSYVERWLTMIKVRAPMNNRPHVLQTAEVFRCRVVDMGEDAIVLEATGDSGKVGALLEAVRPFGILEVASSGAVAMSRTGFAGVRELH
ncbi:MAG TPA: acetolactate synthase small subunit [Synergistaceae bacterium]|nr:acetolactate synthase small subunit [Synergistaceae bacterium]HPJ25679.1 acetolactate synthase small subunit [Synergistaceae bacterium]HPQ36884.1 acetolactate synthase small subunit [Synergistaceae bacterium]